MNEHQTILDRAIWKFVNDRAKELPVRSGNKLTDEVLEVVENYFIDLSTIFDDKAVKEHWVNIAKEVCNLRNKLKA